MSETITIEVEDMTGQIRRRAPNTPRAARVSELIDKLQRDLRLPDVDASGRSVVYGARTSGGDVLNPSDQVGDVLQENEIVTLTRSVTAG